MWLPSYSRGATRGGQPASVMWSRDCDVMAAFGLFADEAYFFSFFFFFFLVHLVSRSSRWLDEQIEDLKTIVAVVFSFSLLPAPQRHYDREDEDTTRVKQTAVGAKSFVACRVYLLRLTHALKIKWLWKNKASECNQVYNSLASFGTRIFWWKR